MSGGSVNPNWRRRILVTFAVCAAGLIGAGFLAYRHIDRTHAQPVRDLSRMMAVKTIATAALSTHYAQHGHYPRSLSELPLHTLPWGDEGSSPADLGQWHYFSEGSSFMMTWTNARGADLYLGGRTGLIFYSRAEGP